MSSVFFVRYMVWHYAMAPVLIVRLWKNLLWYIGHVFSVRTLWRTLFMPWHRITAKRTKRWDFEDAASVFLANLMSRIIGFILRLFLILIGRSLQLIWIIIGVMFYMAWFVLPGLLVSAFLYGWFLLF